MSESITARELLRMQNRKRRPASPDQKQAEKEERRIHRCAIKAITIAGFDAEEGYTIERVRLADELQEIHVVVPHGARHEA